MRKHPLALSLILALTLLLFCSPAEAAGQLTVTESNLLTIPGSGTGLFCAAVENTGDAPIAVGQGKLAVFTDAGELLLVQDYLSATPTGLLLAPGEGTYLTAYLWDEQLGALTAPLTCTVSVRTNDWSQAADVLTATSVLDVDAGTVDVTFTNPSDAILSGLLLNVALRDADGALLGACSTSLDRVGLHPGSTLTVTVPLDWNLTEALRTAGVTISSAEAQVLSLR